MNMNYHKVAAPRRWICPLWASLLLACPVLIQAATGVAPGSLNVMVITIDDHSSYLHSALQKDRMVQTPNMERLARRSVWFTHGYAHPACGPSRTSILTGVNPSTSGIYYNNQAYRRVSGPISSVMNLPQQFKHQGYLTAGYGKIGHWVEDERDAFSPGYYKMFGQESDVRWTDGQLPTQMGAGDMVQIPGLHSAHRYGVLPDDWDRNDETKWQQDTQQAQRTIDLLNRKHDRPFFVWLGLYRPHLPWFAAQRYYDLYPLEDIEVNDDYLPGDLDDVPRPGRWAAVNHPENGHDAVTRHGLWRKYLQAYYASITYVDEQIGRVLDALEASGYADNTVIVFASDNGYHTGQKDHWGKFALWERASRVAFGIHVPGAEPRICPTPVTLVDLYPTLVEVCDLPSPEHDLEGFSLAPILRGETNDRGAPVLMTQGIGNHAIRDFRFRYIRYRNGDEELYDHDNDPQEWHNLAGDPGYDYVKERLARHLPAADAPEAEFVRGDARVTGFAPEAFEEP